MEVRALDDKIEHFLSSFDIPTRARIAKTVHLLELFGHNIGMPHSKGVGNGIFELRIRGRQEIRIFYTFFRDEAVLLHGYKKKSQKIPEREMRVAESNRERLTKI